jgi:hypothetical protein
MVSMGVRARAWRGVQAVFRVQGFGIQGLACSEVTQASWGVNISLIRIMHMHAVGIRNILCQPSSACLMSHHSTHSLAYCIGPSCCRHAAETC